MKYLKVFTDFAKDIEALNDTEVGRLFRAMLLYAESGEEMTFRGNERFVWGTAKKSIDNQAEAYTKRCETNQRIATNRYESSRNVTKKHESCQDKDKDKEKDKEKEKLKKKSFVPPTLDDVRAYCSSRHSNVDPVRFYEYFSEGKWHDSEGKPVRNWKQKLISWEGNSKKAPETKEPVKRDPPDIDRIRRLTAEMQEGK